MPVIAIFVIHVGHTWGHYLLHTEVPKYLHSVHGFKIEHVINLSISVTFSAKCRKVINTYFVRVYTEWVVFRPPSTPQLHGLHCHVTPLGFLNCAKPYLHSVHKENVRDARYLTNSSLSSLHLNLKVYVFHSTNELTTQPCGDLRQHSWGLFLQDVTLSWP